MSELYASIHHFQTLQHLQQNAKERTEASANASAATSSSFTIPQTSTKMSMQELEELRKKLGNVTASSNVPQVLKTPREHEQTAGMAFF